MTALTNNTALTLKYKLETALYKSRQETAMNEMKYLLVEKGIFHETKREQTMEEACEQAIEDSMATRFNIVLWKHYTYGEKIFYHEQKPRWDNRTQMTAAFIYSYFKEEPEAVHHLENVSPSSFNINARDKTILLDERPPQAINIATPGRSDFRADDLWHPWPETLENLPNDAPEEVETLNLDELLRGKWNDDPPSSKRQRVTSTTPSDPETVTSQIRDVDQPPQEFRATEGFWDDYFEQDYARSLEPADPTRKRKFCD